MLRKDPETGELVDDPTPLPRDIDLPKKKFVLDETGLTEYEKARALQMALVTARRRVKALRAKSGMHFKNMAQRRRWEREEEERRLNYAAAAKMAETPKGPTKMFDLRDVIGDPTDPRPEDQRLRHGKRELEEKKPKMFSPWED